MNEKSQRIAIAKIEGYTLRENGIWQDPDGEYVGGWRSLPDYTSDLNAMHRVEHLLGDGYKRVHYLDSLGWVCRRDGMKVPWLECPFANAAQKAESFLYVFGLWVDDAAEPMEKCEWADHPVDDGLSSSVQCSDLIARDIVKFFRRRKGFGHWWDAIDEEVQGEILDELSDLLKMEDLRFNSENASLSHGDESATPQAR